MKGKRTLGSHLRKIFKWWVILIIVVLVVARIMLPSIVLRYVNKSLSEMDGYDGHVEDIDIWLIRGAYVIKDIQIWETDNELTEKDSIPFFKALNIDLSVEWKSLFQGKLVAAIEMNTPVLNFKNKKVDSTSVKSDTADFRQLIRQLIPLTINSLYIENGEIHYIDRYSSPVVDIMMNNIKSTATNLTNVLSKDTLLPSKIIGTGDSYGGTFTLTINLDPLNKVPTFDLNAELKDLDLTQVNNFLKAYGNFDVTEGNFSVYAEFAGRDGKFNGYVKPLLKDLDVVQWNEEEGSIPQIMWETLVASVASILTNQKKDQFATKLNISGDFVNTEISLWSAIKYVIVNAYIEALKPNLENTINIKNATLKTDKKNIKQAIFGKKDKENKK